MKNLKLSFAQHYQKIPGYSEIENQSMMKPCQAETRDLDRYQKCFDVGEIFRINAIAGIERNGNFSVLENIIKSKTCIPMLKY